VSAIVAVVDYVLFNTAQSLQSAMQQSSVNAYKCTFLVTEFVTFGIVYLISWLRRRFLITLEDCLIKLICLSLWCCNDCVFIICFVSFAFIFFVLDIYKWLI